MKTPSPKDQNQGWPNDLSCEVEPRFCLHIHMYICLWDGMFIYTFIHTKDEYWSRTSWYFHNCGVCIHTYYIQYIIYICTYTVKNTGSTDTIIPTLLFIILVIDATAYKTYLIKQGDELLKILHNWLILWFVRNQLSIRWLLII